MRPYKVRILLAVALGFCLAAATIGSTGIPSPATAQLATATSALRWYKGNTHTHTLNSDGDSTPDDVVRWYREHGYQFLVLTDHNFLTSVDGLNALHGADERFLVVKGEEVTSSGEGKPVHVNSLDGAKRVGAQSGGSVLEVLQRSVDAIRGVSARFARQDYVEEAWRIVDPVLDDAAPVWSYEPGSWGPAQVERSLAPSGGWLDPVTS